ncbi:hypothetical protein PG994_005922 [Apiospora phragmitis]|uniref:Uncharacterized protein n=1 Tax=Apiospora phragmitis TaxID=2905665 RepID=A0ABR1VG56_9PEZI
MSSPNLPPGAFITSLGGKRCTAIPKKGGNGGGGGGQQQQTSTTTAAATTTEAPSTTTVQEPPKTSTTQVQAPPPPPPAVSPPPESTTTVIPPRETSTSTTSLTSTSLTSTTLQAPPTQAPPVQTSTAAVVSPPPAPPPPPAAAAETSSVAKLPATSLPSDVPTSTSQTVPSPTVAAPDAPTSTSQAIVPPIIAIPSPSPSSQAQPSDTALRTTGTQTQTADSTAPTATDASPADATTQSSSSAATSTPSVNDDLASGGGRNAGNAAVVTTSGSAVFTITPAASQTAASDAEVTNTGPSTHATKAVVGGVLGGVAFVAIAVLIFWFVRKRLRRKRRSTLLTPLGGPENGFGDVEKRPYIFSRDSIGPTPLSEKFRVTFGHSLKKFRGRVKSLVVRSPSPSVNLDRGNSQFLDGSVSVSDAGRSRSAGRDGSPPPKGRFLGLFSRSNGESGWRFGSRGKQDSEELFANTRGMKDTQRGRSSQPDFLALLNMDDKQLAEQANIKRKTLTGKQNRRSSSAGSADHFLGGLGLSFGSTNPFLDSNAMPHNSAVPPSLSTSPDAKDPFSDTNAIRPPTQSKQIGPPSTYADNVRRSRGQSVGGSRPPSSRPRNGTMYRDSADSVESFQTRRNKFRSDPFDLDRPELLSSSASTSSSQGMPRTSRVPSTPGRAHTRASSYSSRYSSGVNTLDGFGDPGPDVGLATNRYAPPPAASHTKNGSTGQVSVGKAY